MPNAIPQPDQDISSRGPCGLRWRLRHATAEAHAQLDQAFNFLDLQRFSDYRRFLEVTASALLPLEEAMEAAGVEAVVPDWPLRSRRHAILCDLEQLGGVLRQFPTPSPPLTVGGILGTTYVLEGSRLGSRVLLDAVVRSSDPTVAKTTQYLGHGEGHRFWQSYIELLEARGAALDDESDIIDGACRAFALFAEAATSLRTETALA